MEKQTLVFQYLNIYVEDFKMMPLEFFEELGFKADGIQYRNNESTSKRMSLSKKAISVITSYFGFNRKNF